MGRRMYGEDNVWGGGCWCRGEDVWGAGCMGRRRMLV